MSTILYGCESWLNGDLKPVVKIYNWALKQLLGVRMTTCNDVCWVESGFGSLTATVKSKQRKFFVKMFNERYRIQDDPLGFALRLVLNANYSTEVYLHCLINNSNYDDYQNDMDDLKQKIRQSESSRRSVYVNHMNTDLSTHSIYSSKHSIYEPHRTAFTRFRVSSHMLANETGRWNRGGRGRLPIDQRLCSCGAIQSEEHVVCNCPISQNLRDRFGFTCIADLMNGNLACDIVCEIIYELLKLYA